MIERRILVVDDDADVAHAVADVLSGEASRCEIAESARAALSACHQSAFDVVVSDIRMEGMDGVELMARLRHEQPSLPVILLTGDGTIGAAVEAIKRGAFQYLTKPFGATQLRRVVDDAVLLHGRSPRAPAVAAMPSSATSELIGSSPAMARLRERIELVAAATSPVLVVGETGTGKELVARAIHGCGARRSRPFVTVNAAAIPDALLESEMFGHVRGAFTGATQSHRGLFTEADGGTLFLDEIGDMPLGLQTKLLRVLQTGEIRSVGSSRGQNVDVRVVAATHRALPEMVKEGRFRDDLYYRLAVINVTLPPLRARTSDIPELATSFLARARERAPQSPVTAMSPELLELLGVQRWPGNVRELQSTIERLVVLAREERLEPRHLTLIDDGELSPATSAPAPPPVAPAAPVEMTFPPLPGGQDFGLDQLVRRHVEAVLAHADGNKAQAARILGIDLSTLYRWQQKWKR